MFVLASGGVVGLVGDLCCRQWRHRIRIRVVTDLDIGKLNVGEDGYRWHAPKESNERDDSARPLRKRICGL